MPYSHIISLSAMMTIATKTTATSTVVYKTMKGAHYFLQLTGNVEWFNAGELYYTRRNITTPRDAQRQRKTTAALFGVFHCHTPTTHVL